LPCYLNILILDIKKKILIQLKVPFADETS
jgi:hypothetical protein